MLIGSFGKTSKIAVFILLFLRAILKSSKSTFFPLAELIKTRFFFEYLKKFLLIILLVSFVTDSEVIKNQNILQFPSMKIPLLTFKTLSFPLSIYGS